YDLKFPEQLQEAKLKLLPAGSSSFWTEAQFDIYFPQRKQLGGKVQVTSFQEGLTLALYGDQKSGACRGDSGGPAIIIENGQPKLIGVTSQATDSNTCAATSLYTSFYKLGDWIREQVR